MGQAGYAAANAFLDALAVARRRSGRPGLSVQWGPVAGVGLAARRADRGDRLADRGMDSVPVADCWPALLRFLTDGETVVGYAALDPRRWVQTYPAVASLRSWGPLLDAAPQPVAGEAMTARLRELPAPQRQDLVAATVTRDAALVLMVDADVLARERDVPLKALGLDSLMAIELRNRLESSLGLRLSPTLLWRHGNLARLGAALSELIGADQAAGAARIE